MNGMKNRVQENYRWTAYMKLKGQTWARKEDEILDEFEGFVQSLRGVGVNYNIIVLVEGKAPRELRSESKMEENMRESIHKVSNERAGA
jgi:hypothetical protein